VILTVTLNTALDITYRMDEVEWGQSNRVREVGIRAGGKGINVARILHALGHDVLVIAFAGGANGEVVRGEMVAAGMAARLVTTGGETRRTVAIVEASRTTVLNEPGPHITTDEWTRFRHDFESALSGCDVVVLSGSLPPGVPDDAYAVLIDAARGTGAAAVLDAGGAALVAGLAARPAIAKPNVRELEAATGQRYERVEDVLAGAEWLRAAGAEAGVVTWGANGIVTSTAAGALLAQPPERLAGNETGAGDAVAAALAIGQEEDRPWRSRLCDAVAAGAAAMLREAAGEIDLHAYARFRSGVRIESL
jgi:1-phosphofructokinase family hexose kinase